MPAESRRSAASATVTRSLTPSKLSAPPNLPPGTQAGPETVPVCPLPLASAADVPAASSNAHAATRPVGPGTTVFETVSATGAEVVELFDGSRATAVSVWPPFDAVVVVHETEYGADVSSPPRFAPSSLNCTPATASLSPAVAVTLTVPET